MKIFQKFNLLALVVLLAGCGTTPATFDNRAMCTLAKDSAYVVSMYGPIGLSSKVNGRDAAAMCGASETTGAK